MKAIFKTLGLVALLAFSLVSTLGQVARADDNNGISFQTFYDQLSSQGTWIQTDNYGYVFQPNVSSPNWQPYTYGHWVNTDQGMMWVSDESFGWATDHYGRWVNLDNYGWVWVPGYTWAPAWVSWREGGDDVGWAPLPPETAVGVDFVDPGFGFGFGFHIGDDCDLAFGIGPAWYNFCPVAYIGDRDCWRHFRDRGDNFALINNTRNITNINVSTDPRSGRFGRVHANGPSVASLNMRSRTPIRQVQLTSASTLNANGRLHGNSLSVFAPKVNPNTVKGAQPHSVSATLASTRVNRGTNINNPLAVNSRVRAAGPTSEQIHAATVAQGNVSAGAKIATAGTNPSRPLTKPLTSLHANAVTGGSFRSASSASSSYSGNTGQAAFHHTTSMPYTSSSSTFHPSSSWGGSSYSPSGIHSSNTGQAAFHHTTSMPHTSSTSSTFHPFTSWGGGSNSYHPPSIVQHSSAPVFHSSAPAYHPQSSFHSFAPAQHFGGGGGAPHFSGGGASHFSGGGAPHFSGGGAPHFSGGGGGHSGGGGQAHTGGGGNNRH